MQENINMNLQFTYMKRIFIIKEMKFTFTFKISIKEICSKSQFKKKIYSWNYPLESSNIIKIYLNTSAFLSYFCLNLNFIMKMINGNIKYPGLKVG